ncbi:aminotransferase [Planococcus lenghuensis]|uniref:Aminotransferase n=1 Tax=Planococcus lenghuensis TaxID=2213202 RepID=A0A1Q2L307_9BACL|nr:aminotransferase [Planococcus lenghuensis]AQQ54809.1 aminotransferase [Planococcus lenghuensis]
MNIKPFAIEEWMNEYEQEAVYNLAETCVDSLSIEELVTLGGEDYDEFFRSIADTKLTYGHITGSPGFKKNVANLYKTMTPDNILSMNGAIGANFLVLYTLIEPGDEVVCVDPTYQQLHSVPESFGADVKRLRLTPENNYLPDLEELASLVNDKTKLVIINNPNNPSGSVMDADYLERIVAIARKHDVYVLCDEVYRGLWQDPDANVPAMADLYEKGISTGSMSKSLSLAGLRLGWIAGPEELIERCIVRRDYTTISNSGIDDLLAVRALENYDRLMERNLKIVRDNLQILDDWVAKEDKISYFKPQAGTTAILKYEADMPSDRFCIGLFKANGTFLAPGSCFDLEGTVRIGYACSTDVLKQGLTKFSEYLKTVD